MPFFRNHSAIESKRQEPWAFGEKYEKIIKRNILCSAINGCPICTHCLRKRIKASVMRALFLEYPHDEKTYNIHDQFCLAKM